MMDPILAPQWEEPQRSRVKGLSSHLQLTWFGSRSHHQQSHSGARQGVGPHRPRSIPKIPKIPRRPLGIQISHWWPAGTRPRAPASTVGQMSNLGTDGEPKVISCLSVLEESWRFSGDNEGTSPNGANKWADTSDVQYGVASALKRNGGIGTCGTK